MNNDPKSLPDRMVEDDFAGVKFDNSNRDGEPFDFDAPADAAAE